MSGRSPIDFYLIIYNIYIYVYNIYICHYICTYLLISTLLLWVYWCHAAFQSSFITGNFPFSLFITFREVNKAAFGLNIPCKSELGKGALVYIVSHFKMVYKLYFSQLLLKIFRKHF